MPRAGSLLSSNGLQRTSLRNQTSQIAPFFTRFLTLLSLSFFPSQYVTLAKGKKLKVALGPGSFYTMTSLMAGSLDKQTLHSILPGSAPSLTDVVDVDTGSKHVVRTHHECMERLASLLVPMALDQPPRPTVRLPFWWRFPSEAQRSLTPYLRLQTARSELGLEALQIKYGEDAQWILGQLGHLAVLDKYGEEGMSMVGHLGHLALLDKYGGQGLRNLRTEAGLKGQAALLDKHGEQGLRNLKSEAGFKTAAVRLQQSLERQIEEQDARSTPEAVRQRDDARAQRAEKRLRR